jgi:hypothetical protein
MLRTYKALLRGNSLEWIGEAPERSEDYPMTVRSTPLPSLALPIAQAALD